MIDARQKAAEAAGRIRGEIKSRPEIGLLTGTGLGDSVAAMEVAAAYDYADIPHFPVSTVETHRGRLLVGTLAGRSTVAMQGRFHLYEGYTAREVSFPIRVMQELGVTCLVLTNAAGGINPGFRTGDIMIITDHVNLTGENPLIGPNEDSWGPRFPDMIAVYDKGLQRDAESVARDAGFGLQRGVYAGLKGPSLETPAEIRFLKSIGADAVGFSTVQEAIAAAHGKMRVLALSIITNVHDPEAPAPARVDEIIRVASDAVPRLQAVISGVTRHLGV